MSTRTALADLDMRWSAADLLRVLQAKLTEANDLDRARAWVEHGPRTATGRRARMPARRDRALARLPLEVADALQRRAKRRLEIYGHIYARARQVYTDVRLRLLRTHVPEVAPRYHAVETVSSSSYHTQGYGQYAYARERAQRDVDALVAAGIDAVVGECSPVWARPRSAGAPSCLTPPRSVEYVINARCERVDLQAARLREPVDLAELVRRCWARGVNPRVYWPMLPHDFEKAHGIDYQGHRTAAGER